MGVQELRQRPGVFSSSACAIYDEFDFVGDPRIVGVLSRSGTVGVLRQSLSSNDKHVICWLFFRVIVLLLRVSVFRESMGVAGLISTAFNSLDGGDGATMSATEVAITVDMLDDDGRDSGW